MAKSSEQVIALLQAYGGRAGGSDCPSWYTLDRYQLDELPASEAQAVRAHVAGCSACRAELAEEAALYHAAFPLHEQTIEARATAEADGGMWARLLRFLSGAGLGVVAIAVAAMLLLFQPKEPEHKLSLAGPATQRKGAQNIQLNAFREHRGKVEPMTSGSTVSPGDRVRFQIDVPDSREVMIVGVEEHGRLFSYYPLDGQGRSAHHEGGQVLLEGAAELDTSHGREAVVLVSCKQPFALSTLRAGVSPDCQTEGFTIYKDSQ